MRLRDVFLVAFLAFFRFLAMIDTSFRGKFLILKIFYIYFNTKRYTNKILSRVVRVNCKKIFGGPERIRTADLLIANEAF